MSRPIVTEEDTPPVIAGSGRCGWCPSKHRRRAKENRSALAPNCIDSRHQIREAARPMKIISGKLLRPERTIIIGTPGIGKSTYGASTLRPIFLEAETGSDELDVQRCRRDDESPLETYAEAVDAVRWLTEEPHNYQTLVIDTMDWLVSWIERHVIIGKSKDGEPYTSIEDFGFGKGYVVVQEELRRFLALLEKLQAKRGMDVLMLVHASIKKFNPPDSDPYERFDMKIQDKSASLLREWAHNMLLAQLDVSVKKGDKKKGEKNKATGDGDRVLRTTETAAYLAKNRIGLEPTIPFDDQTYSVIQAARKRCLTSDAELATQLESLLVGASDPDATRAWFKAQANKSAAIEALRKRAASAAKETQSQ